MLKEVVSRWLRIEFEAPHSGPRFEGAVLALLGHSGWGTLEPMGAKSSFWCVGAPFWHPVASTFGLPLALGRRWQAGANARPFCPPSGTVWFFSHTGAPPWEGCTHCSV